ncbi:sensor histidine kinase [Symbioplanes lichenis]|uniref:sensor histidine kinase n=1 Tax=Symbioplanes lichenis TaxID=1629072 RepID=UPI0027396122|nr:HAMP domain-containing sensor histidine kinase [Actinoplanes lichenis]
MARTSVQVRTTSAAVLVVAVALVLGAFALVFLVRSSLREGAETTAEQQAAALAQQISTSGLPSSTSDDFPWRVLDAEGSEVRSTPDFSDESDFSVSEEAGPYTVVVGASLEEVDDSTEALTTPLLVGVPLLLLLVGATTWIVAGRALAPVERIRREVEEITGDRLDRRVPEPASRDEIARLARTMNQMLVRLETAATRQQQFVADASHELRSPLAGIRQAAEVSRAHPDALPPGELADAVLQESARLQRLVEQLLTLARTGSARPTTDVDLDDLALAAARRIHQLSVDTTGIGPARVRGDATALTQVVRNLTDNAARHATSTVAVSVRTHGDQVELLVDDDGPGIPPGQRTRVFERFVRLDEARARDEGGSGLGLAIVHDIITAAGGTVTISPSPHGGARFTVTLPAA